MATSPRDKEDVLGTAPPVLERFNLIVCAIWPPQGCVYTPELIFNY